MRISRESLSSNFWKPYVCFITTHIFRNSWFFVITLQFDTIFLMWHHKKVYLAAKHTKFKNCKKRFHDTYKNRKHEITSKTQIKMYKPNFKELCTLLSHYVTRDSVARSRVLSQLKWGWLFRANVNICAGYPFPQLARWRWFQLDFCFPRVAQAGSWRSTFSLHLFTFQRVCWCVRLIRWEERRNASGRNFRFKINYFCFICCEFLCVFVVLY